MSAVETISHVFDSESNSPRVEAATGAHPNNLSEDGEDDFKMSHETGRTGTGSEDSYDEKEDTDDLLPEAAIMIDETPATSTPSDQEGMLPRDMQRKTAYYDYVAEKQLSQADMKLFYQRSQLEAQKTGGSNWNASQPSVQGSPVLIPNNISSFF